MRLKGLKEHPMLDQLIEAVAAGALLMKGGGELFSAKRRSDGSWCMRPLLGGAEHIVSADLSTCTCGGGCIHIQVLKFGSSW